MLYSEDNDLSCLGEEMFNSFRKYKDRVAHIYAESGETETYSELLKKSIRVALHLKDLGLTRNDVIGACDINRVNSSVPLIASQLLGFKIATFHESFSVTDISNLLHNVIKPKVLFLFEEVVPKFEKSFTANQDILVIVIGYTDRYLKFNDFIKPHPEEDNFKPCKVNINDTAIILFTSGSSGFAKAAALNHRPFKQSKHFKSTDLPSYLMDRSKFINFINLYGISATFMYFFCWYRGILNVILKEFNAKIWLKTVEAYKIDFANLGPSELSEIVEFQRGLNLDVSSLKLIYLVGAGAKGNLLEEAYKVFRNAAIIHTYGQTEAGGIITCFYPNPEDVEMQKRKPYSSGRVLDDNFCKIVDPETEEVLGPYQTGELRCKTANMMNGYYNMDLPDTFDKDGWFKTGDLAYYDEDNCFYIVDRIKQVFKYKECHIFPGQIENLLKSHSDVKEAAVVGIPAGNLGEIPCAFVSLKEGATSSAEEIRKYADDQLSDLEKIRGGVKIVDKFPFTPTRKINKFLLRQMIIENKN